MDHLYELDYLKEGIYLRSYAQKDPLIEYKQEAFQLFANMNEEIDKAILWGLFHARLTEEDKGERRAASGTAVHQAASAYGTAEAAAVERGVELLLSARPLDATYPTASRVSDRWFKLGFPLSYRADVLQAMLALAQAGYADHPFVQASAKWLLAKRDIQGRWTLEQVPGKMWASFGQVGQPNKWVTLRAAQLLKAAGKLPWTDMQD